MASNKSEENFIDEPDVELLRIWEDNNQARYSAEEFEAVKRILLSRGISLPPQKEFIRFGDKGSLLVRGTDDLLGLGLSNQLLRFDVKAQSTEIALTDHGLRRGAVLHIGARGLCLTVPVERGERDFFVPWSDLRELKNELLSKGNFSANFAADNSDFRFSVKVANGDAPSLSSIFNKLPDTAVCSKCPVCGGPVKQGLCTSCGRQMATSIRRRGLYELIFGVILACIGTALTIGGKSLAESMGFPFFLIFYGFILAGAIVFIKGLLELLLGKKL